MEIGKSELKKSEFRLNIVI